MTLLYRFALLGLLTSLMTACETLYIEQPMQPAPSQVYVPVNPQPMPQPAPAAAYPSQSQPVQVPVPVQAPPLPQSAPPRAMTPPAAAVRRPAAVVPVQPVIDDGSSNGHVIPVRAPGSISDLPDPS